MFQLLVLGCWLLIDEPHLLTHVKCIAHRQTSHFKLVTEMELYITVHRCIVGLHFPPLTTSRIINGATLKGSGGGAAIPEDLPGTPCASNPWNVGMGENSIWTGPEQARVPRNCLQR